MKKLVLSTWFSISFLLIISAIYFAGFSDSSSKLSAMHKNDVVLYATSWCPYCEKTRVFFRENNIYYIEYDIEQSQQARKQFEMLNGKGIPLVVAEGKIIRGFNTDAILKALEKNKNDS